jgi:hypothetical protein
MSEMMSSMPGQGKIETLNRVLSAKSRLGSTTAATTLPAKNAATNGVGFVLANTEAVVAITVVSLIVQEASLDLQILVSPYSS